MSGFWGGFDKGKTWVSRGGKIWCGIVFEFHVMDG